MNEKRLFYYIQGGIRGPVCVYRRMIIVDLLYPSGPLRRRELYVLSVRFGALLASRRIAFYGYVRLRHGFKGCCFSFHSDSTQARRIALITTIMTAGNITTERPLARSPSSPTHSHHHSFSVPTPALLESLAGGAHYSGVKIDHDASKARRNSHGKPSNHLEVKADHKKVIEDLQELYSCRPTVEIFERRWRPDAIFEVRDYSFSIQSGK